MLKWRRVVWPCNPTSNRPGLIFSLKSTSVVRFIRYWVNNTKDDDQQFDLDLWQCDQKINRGHLLPRGIHFTKFGNFLANGSGDIEQRTLHKDQQFDLGQCDKKINKGHLLPRSIHWTKFATCQKRGPENPEILSGHQLTLTFDHVTWKSIGNIYSLGASTQDWQL